MRNFIDNRDTRYADIPNNLTSTTCRNKLESLLQNPTVHKVESEYNHNDVREKLLSYFGKKCVYCESSPIATSTFRIDHHRPKKNIKENNTHTGYYWLGYEWSNLLQACENCNGKKSNHFPLKHESSRVTHETEKALDISNWKPTTAPLIHEERLLLHPELDDVEQYFTFNTKGEIKSNTLKGKKSIELYDLQREGLVQSRKAIYNQFVNSINEMLVAYEEDIISIDASSALRILERSFNRLLSKLFLLTNINKEHSLFSSFMFDNFEQFIIADLSFDEHKEILTEAYLGYINDLQ